MNAADIMTKDIVTVTPTTSVRQVAELLVKHRISAVPVVDRHGKLVGIASEGDLVSRAGLGGEDHQSWWLQVLAEGEDLSPEFVNYLRSGEARVGDVMTKDVVTVDGTATLPHIAKLFQEHGINRVPVVEDGKPVGVVSRADLVRVIAQREDNVVQQRRS